MPRIRLVTHRRRSRHPLQPPRPPQPPRPRRPPPLRRPLRAAHPPDRWRRHTAPGRTPYGRTARERAAQHRRRAGGKTAQAYPAAGSCSLEALPAARTRSTSHNRCVPRDSRQVCRRALPAGICSGYASARPTTARARSRSPRSCAGWATTARCCRSRGARDGLRRQRSRCSCTIRAARGHRGHDGQE